MNEERTLYARIGGHEGLVRLLQYFYADVRQHRVIGPIFMKRIQDWKAHISKIAEFWARATGGPSFYAGQMPMKHLSLELEPEHFGFWLELWDFNCQRHLGEAEAEEMSRLAHGIGARLQQIVSAHRRATWRLRLSRCQRLRLARNRAKGFSSPPGLGAWPLPNPFPLLPALPR